MDFGMFLLCKLIYLDNLHRFYIQVLRFWVAQCRTRIHHPGVDNYMYKFLCDFEQYRMPLEHMGFQHKGVGILSLSLKM